jgi:2-iminobutanoate/2-iminopropanoate deaminase
LIRTLVLYSVPWNADSWHAQELLSVLRKPVGKDVTMAKQPVGGSKPAGSYSAGIIAEGRFVYVSGQGPLRDGAVIGAGIEEQTRVTLGNLAAVLEAAGATLADVVRCGVFLADGRDFDAMDKVYAGTFPRPLPARTTVGVTFPLPGMLVEIDCVAVLPSTGLPAAGGGQPAG